MIIYWVLFIGIIFQTTIGDELDIDESVLTAEEEEVGIQKNEKRTFISNNYKSIQLLHPSAPTTAAPVEDQTIHYESPYPSPGKFHFAENFDKEEYFTRRWIKSTAKKDDIEESLAKYDGVWSVEEPQRPILKGDLGMVLKSKAKHAAVRIFLWIFLVRFTTVFAYRSHPVWVNHSFLPISHLSSSMKFSYR